MRSTIRVLVVDDSALIRQMLTRALDLDPRIEIVGIAKTGVEAIEKAESLAPDVITLDIEMPELSGLEALPHLKKRSDARVVMLSSVDDPDTTYQALAAGAVDFVSKPKSGVASSIAELSEALIRTIHTAYLVDPGRLRRVLAEESKLASQQQEAPPPPRISTPVPATSDTLEWVVALAASTGGPPALERVFEGLAASLPAAYVIVQHLPSGFAASFARRLSAASDIEAVEAAEGMKLRPGRAYLAPYGAHMIVIETAPSDFRIHLQDGPFMHGVRPSADPLFSSVAKVFGSRVTGVVLTGMGADGADGLGEIKASGGETIAQNEETSVVWGMPGAAAKAGAAKRLVPIGLVAAEIRRTIRGGWPS